MSFRRLRDVVLELKRDWLYLSKCLKLWAFDTK
jgi:hypothetical protein